jgi:hypothetical protein
LSVLVAPSVDPGSVRELLVPGAVAVIALAVGATVEGV